MNWKEFKDVVESNGITDDTPWDINWDKLNLKSKKKHYDDFIVHYESKIENMNEILKPTEFKFMRVPADTERIIIPKGSISVSIIDIPEIDDTLYHRKFYKNVTYVQWLEPNDSPETIASFNKQMELLADMNRPQHIFETQTNKKSWWKRCYNFIFHENI